MDQEEVLKLAESFVRILSPAAAKYLFDKFLLEMLHEEGMGL